MMILLLRYKSKAAAALSERICRVYGAIASTVLSKRAAIFVAGKRADTHCMSRVRSRNRLTCSDDRRALLAGGQQDVDVLTSKQLWNVWPLIETSDVIRRKSNASCSLVDEFAAPMTLLVTITSSNV